MKIIPSAGVPSLPPPQLLEAVQTAEDLFFCREYESASTYLKGAIADPAAGPWSGIWLSLYHQAKHELVQSRVAVQSVLNIYPNWPVALLRFVGLLDPSLHSVEIAETLNRLCSLHRQDSMVLKDVARAFLVAHQYESAYSTAEIAEALPGELGSLASALKLLSAAKMRQPASTELFEHAVANASADVFPRLAHICMDVGELEVLRRVLVTGRSHAWSVPLLLRLAQGFKHRGQYTASLEILGVAKQLQSESRHIERALQNLRSEMVVTQGFWIAPPLESNQISGCWPKILHVVAHSLPYAKTGYDIRTHSIVKSQRDAGLEPHVVTPCGFPGRQGVAQAPICERFDGIDYHRLAPDSKLAETWDCELAANTRALSQLVRNLRPSVLHAASNFMVAMAAFPVAETCGIPFIYEVRGFWHETWVSKRDVDATSSDHYMWSEAREIEYMQKAAVVVTLADVMRDEIIKKGISPDKIRVIPNAVDVEQFTPQARDENLADRLGIVQGEVVLGYISSFVSYEGIKYLLDAVHLLAKAGRRVRCLLVGDGPERVSLEEQVEVRGIRHLVKFAGRVPHSEIRQYYSLIDIFVVPRTNDRVSRLVTPLKPYEAMAMERAVIVSRTPALAEMVVNGVTALTFAPENPEDLAHVVDSIIDQPSRRRQLGIEARRWVSENRNWRANGRRYLELYETLFRGR